MRLGMTYNQGDILLVPIPFSDLTSYKKRPVLVISNNEYNRASLDLIVVAITSNLNYLENKIILEKEDLLRGNLKYTSSIKIDKIYTLSKGIIVKQFGVVQREKLLQVISGVKKILEIKK
jgi:mRNA interferase MazF